MNDRSWLEMTLGEFVTLQRGHDLPETRRRPGAVPVLGSFGITGYHNEARTKGPGITVGRSGASFGVVTYSHIDYWPLNTALYVTDFHGNDERFAYYFLNSLDFKRYNSGSAQPSLNRNFIHPIRIKVPPPAEQRRIADILGTLDDKIELNRRMNETLEGICRAIFKSWFIDFDPVHAKAALRRQHPKLTNAELSRRALPHLDPKIAELFPDRFTDSLLGSIPHGWPIARLSDHVEAAKGLSYKGSGLSDAGKPLHNLNSVYEGGGYKFDGIKFYNSDHKDRHIVKAGEVIVANTEQGHDCLLLGYAAIIPDSFGEDGLFSHHIYRMRIRRDSPLTADFLCRLLNSQRMHDLVSGYGNGTTVNMLPIAGVELPEFVLPSSKIIDAFTDLATNARIRQGQVMKENRVVTATRDALLPKLLSGETLPATVTVG